MTRTVARLLADSLEAHDVDQIFCVPGESYVGLTSALTERNSHPHDRLPARGRRRLHGGGRRPAAQPRRRAASSRAGPGLSNAMVSLHSAYHDATPMVMLVGQVERKDFGRLALQEQNYSRLLSDVTKCVIEVNEPEQASEAIARAFHLAESGTPGPVAVILPEDIFDEDNRRRTRTSRARACVAGPRAAGPRSPGRDAGEGGAAAGAGRRRAAGRRAARRRGVRRPAAGWPRNGCCRSTRRIAGRNCSTRGIRTTAATWASACRRALIGEMKKADLMVALGERLTDTRQPVLQLPRRAAAATAAGACLAGRQRGRPRLARRPRHRRADPHEVIKGAAGARRPGGCGEARAAGSTGCTRSIARCWRRPGSRPPTASTSPPSSARSTSTWRRRRDGHLRRRQFRQLSASLYRLQAGAGCSCPRWSARWARACRWRWPATLRRPGKQVVAFMGDGGALMMGNEIATACQYGGNPIIDHLRQLDVRHDRHALATCAIRTARSWKRRG